MIEWVLIIDMAYTSQKVGMKSREACETAMETVYKANESMLSSSDVLQAMAENAICINTSTGQIVRHQ